jgi:hypothetical protein
VEDLPSLGEAPQHVYADFFDCLPVESMRFHQSLDRRHANQLLGYLFERVEISILLTSFEPLFGHERLRQQHYRHMMVKSPPGAALKLVGTEDLFDVPVELLDRPSEVRPRDRNNSLYFISYIFIKN